MSSVGETLAAERRRQGKTISDVENATKIMGRMLEAIEHDRHEDLPSPVYVKGYLQSYAKFLGLDQTAILAEYKKEASLEAPEDPLTLPDTAVVLRRDQFHTIPLRTWLMIVGGLVIVGFVIWAISGIGGGDQLTTTIPPVTTSTVETTETQSPGETTETVDTASTEVDVDNSFLMTITVDEGAASWLRVTVDGLNAYEGTLAGGQTKEWTVTDLATVMIGKPGSVTVSRDGVAVPVETADGTGSVTLTASSEE